MVGHPHESYEITTAFERTIFAHWVCLPDKHQEANLRCSPTTSMYLSAEAGVAVFRVDLVAYSTGCRSLSGLSVFPRQTRDLQAVGRDDVRDLWVLLWRPRLLTIPNRCMFTSFEQGRREVTEVWNSLSVLTNCPRSDLLAGPRSEHPCPYPVSGAFIVTQARRCLVRTRNIRQQSKLDERVVMSPVALYDHLSCRGLHFVSASPPSGPIYLAPPFPASHIP